MKHPNSMKEFRFSDGDCSEEEGEGVYGIVRSQRRILRSP